MIDLWTFDTARFRVELTADYDYDPDLSWRDAEQVEYDREHNVEYYVFVCKVYLDGVEIASDSLGGSGYSNPRDFVREPRDPNPMNRNCTIMRAVRGENTSICHYFPSMVAEAVASARRYLADAPRLRA